ncbi:hypothetical protein GH714_028632 [Hevea brasiliensis]|uniref:Uncharacterized protein n=1 Tax=Hevea brasiliensis TaxID=3981 RepID=A0A6A6MIL4_HEVBR|nr:hypothetical protein GH714_028632 [Hevea brasiliensis]
MLQLCDVEPSYNCDADSGRWDSNLFRHLRQNPENGVLGECALLRVPGFVAGFSAPKVQGSIYHLLSRGELNKDNLSQHTQQNPECGLLGRAALLREPGCLVGVSSPIVQGSFYHLKCHTTLAATPLEISCTACASRSLEKCFQSRSLNHYTCKTYIIIVGGFTDSKLLRISIDKISEQLFSSGTSIMPPVLMHEEIEQSSVSEIVTLTCLGINACNLMIGTKQSNNSHPGASQHFLAVKKKDIDAIDLTAAPSEINASHARIIENFGGNMARDPVSGAGLVDLQSTELWVTHKGSAARLAKYDLWGLTLHFTHAGGRVLQS